MIRPAVILCLIGLLLGRGVRAEPLTLRLFTHNLHAEEALLDGFVANIREAEADIVALQEVSPAAAERFADELGELYPHRADSLEAGRYHGQLILSRWPITDRQAWDFPRRLLRVEIAFDDRTLVVYNAHPASPGSTQMDPALRDDDIAFVLEQAQAETAPVILMGDFNLEPWSDTYKTLSASFTDTFAAVGEGLGPTYPDYSQPQARVNARLPRFTPLFLRIDYIFVSAALQPLEARVWPSSGGSDHRPLLAVVAVSP